MKDRNKIKIRGILYLVKITLLKDILVLFFGDELIYKSTYYGEEFKIENDNILFYCYAALDGKGGDGKYNYHIDAECFDKEIEVKVFIDKLVEKFIEKEVIFELEYQLEDKDDLPIENEVLITHPDYLNFMQNHY